MPREEAKYYVYSLNFLNWNPAEHDYWIEVLWTKDKPFSRSSDSTSKSSESTISSGVSSLFVTFGFESLLHFIVFSTLVIYVKRRKQA
ncbi:MAG: hypothetical protein JSW11_00160 [Candidatus Heimdallarchaeota archaeon]|nr:MAG: hypothetical protein JSW11_00160 [Candidatus Heimdallarchaeota archaeon]